MKAYQDMNQDELKTLHQQLSEEEIKEIKIN